MRKIILNLHRYVGLLAATVLILMGATGATLPFFDELDALFNPGMHAASPAPGAPLLDPLVLMQRAQEQVPEASFHDLPLHIERDRAAVFRASAKPGGPKPAQTEYFLNPYTGDIQGGRRYGDISQGPTNLMPWIFAFHKSLFLGKTGKLLQGIAALLLGIEAVGGLFLTLPPKPRQAAPQRSWFSRWAPAWAVKWGSGLRTTFTLHRAVGLWICIIMLVYSLSGMHLRLPKVFNPSVASVGGGLTDLYAHLPAANVPVAERLSFADALAAARARMQEKAAEDGFKVLDEQALASWGFNGLYYYRVHSTLDISGRMANTALWIHPKTGKMVYFRADTRGTPADRFVNWLVALHFARAFGLTERIITSMFGILLVTLSVSGVYLWWRRLRMRGRVRRKAALEQDAAVETA